MNSAKDRYLDALGFEKTASTDTTDSPNRPHRNRSKGPHTNWRSTDGKWERRIDLVETSDDIEIIDLAEPVARTDTKADMTETWKAFKATEGQAERDELIVFYSPLVKYVASRVAAGLPQNVDHADLVSYGMFGLIDAIRKFDLERGYKFETYAISRIKGAILDELRSVDWIPRSIRSKAKSVEKAMTKLEAKLHRSPTDDEIAAEMKLSIPQLNNLYTKISSLGLVALDEMLSFSGGENLTYGDTLADREDGPGDVYENLETRQVLASAINSMSERERVVLTLYYYEGLTLADIGDVLGVTESRVCQIHTKAVLQLRSKMASEMREVA